MKKYNSGFVALVSILVISMVALSVVVSISLTGVGEAKSSLDFKKGQETIQIGYGCGEEALLRTRNDQAYTGGTLSVGEGSCTIIVNDIAGGQEILVNAQLSGPPSYEKNLRITSSQDGNGVTVVTWEEQ